MEARVCPIWTLNKETRKRELRWYYYFFFGSELISSPPIYLTEQEALECSQAHFNLCERGTLCHSIVGN